MTSTVQIIKRLEHVESELAHLKKHVIDADTIFTSDDLKALSGAEEEFRKGKTRRL